MNIGLTDVDITGVAADPYVSNLVYVGTGTGGVFRSSDGGNTWNEMNPGLDGRFEREVTSGAWQKLLT